MFTKVKITLTGLVVVFAIVAFTASAAAEVVIEAPFWNIGAKRLNLNETRGVIIETPESKEMILHGVLKNEAIEIRCGKGVFSNSLFEGSRGKHDGSSYGTMELTNCKLYAKGGVVQSNCKVGEPIKSEALFGRLWLEGTKAAGLNRIVIVFKAWGSKIAEVTISGGECGYANTYKLEGNFAANIEPEKEETKLSRFIFPVKPIEHVWQPPEQSAEEVVALKFNGTKASLQSEQEVELVKKEEVSEFAPHETHEFISTAGTPMTKAEGTMGEAKLATEVLKNHIVISCKKARIEGEIQKISRAKGSIVLEDCAIEGQPNCGVPTISVSVEVTLAGTLVSEGKTAPASGEVFTEIEISGASCPLKGRYKVVGSQTCKLPSGEVFAVSHEIKCTSAGSNLKFGGENATFESNGKIELRSKKEWGAV